eukprot:scaffold1707_cov357-Prasinococcus_capsulatus_cf.AAC.17
MDALGSSIYHTHHCEAPVDSLGLQQRREVPTHNATLMASRAALLLVDQQLRAHVACECYDEHPEQRPHWQSFAARVKPAGTVGTLPGLRFAYVGRVRTPQ